MARFKVIVEVDDEKLRRVGGEAAVDGDQMDLEELVRQEIGWASDSGIYVESVEEIKE